MDLIIPSINLVALAPEIILIGTALLLLVADVIVGGRRTSAFLSLAGIGGGVRGGVAGTPVPGDAARRQRAGHDRVRRLRPLRQTHHLAGGGAERLAVV